MEQVKGVISKKNKKSPSLKSRPFTQVFKVTLQYSYNPMSLKKKGTFVYLTLLCVVPKRDSKLDY